MAAVAVPYVVKVSCCPSVPRTKNTEVLVMMAVCPCAVMRPCVTKPSVCAPNLGPMGALMVNVPTVPSLGGLLFR